MINLFIFVCGVLLGVLFGVWIFIRISKDTEWANFDLKEYDDFKAKQEWLRRAVLKAGLLSIEDSNRYYDSFD